MQSEEQVPPDDEHQQWLPQESLVTGPEAGDDVGVGGLRTHDLGRDARAEDVRDQHERHREAQRKLGQLPRRHAQRIPPPEGVEPQHRMDDEREIEQRGTRPAAPDRRNHLAHGLLGVHGDDAERVIGKVDEDKQREHESGRKAQGAEGSHGGWTA